MNKDDSAVLRSIQKNTEMAMKAIETIGPKVGEKNLESLLEKNKKQYQDIHRDVVTDLEAGGRKPEKTAVLDQMMLVGGITTNTMLNTSTSHIAELMIKGSNMGILDITKTLNHHPQAGAEAKKQADRLLNMENENLEAYKKYL